MYSNNYVFIKFSFLFKYVFNCYNNRPWVFFVDEGVRRSGERGMGVVGAEEGKKRKGGERGRGVGATELSGVVALEQSDSRTD
jgi:hypothetical protein